MVSFETVMVAGSPPVMGRTLMYIAETLTLEKDKLAFDQRGIHTVIHQAKCTRQVLHNQPHEQENARHLNQG